MASHSVGDSGEAPRRAVTAFFDDRGAAQQAVDDLVAAKVARQHITLVEGGTSPVAVEPVPTSDKGLWATLKDLFMADEDRHAYGEGLRRGGCLLSVMTAAADHDRVLEILDREGAVDMDARQSDWELEGWDPMRAASDLRATRDLAPSSPSSEVSVSSTVAPGRAFTDDLRAAIEPAAPVGPAFAADETGRAPGGPVGRTVVRDGEAEGLRLRTYVESRHRHGPAA